MSQSPCDEPSPNSGGRRRAPEPDPPGNWAESPWVWLGMFAAVGLLALVVVMPKYAQRQGRLEQRYQHRIEVAQRLAAAPPATASPSAGEEQHAATVAPPLDADANAVDSAALGGPHAAGEPVANEATTHRAEVATYDDGVAHRMDRGQPRAVLTPLIVVLAGVLAGAIVTLVWVTVSRLRQPRVARHEPSVTITQDPRT